jgi:predicted RNase H-like HicB family nuclease
MVNSPYHEGNSEDPDCEEPKMKRNFTAYVWQENEWFVAQCLEIDIASQGETEKEAIENLREAIELYYETPVAGFAEGL